MPHRTHKYTNTLYDYAIIIINTYVSLMYEFKKMERYLRVNLLGSGPRLTKKEFTGPRAHKGLRNTGLERLLQRTRSDSSFQIPVSSLSLEFIQ